MEYRFNAPDSVWRSFSLDRSRLVDSRDTDSLVEPWATEIASGAYILVQRMSTNSPIRFKFAPLKALNAIHWMVRQKPGLDLHTMLKACYFADKAQLNAQNQPVFGATYRAMRFGPVPVEIYEMAKGEALWLAETEQTMFPWRLDGYHLSLRGNEEPDLSVFSESDRDALNLGFSQSSSMTFSERTAATHGADWQAAALGIMKYEDMLEALPDKDERIVYLEQVAPYLRL